MTWLQTVSLFLSDFLWGKGGTRTGKKGNSARRERKFHQKICPTCPQLLQVACSFRVLSIKHVSLVSEDLVEKYFFFLDIFFIFYEYSFRSIQERKNRPFLLLEEKERKPPSHRIEKEASRESDDTRQKFSRRATQQVGPEESADERVETQAHPGARTQCRRRRSKGAGGA